MQPTTRVLRVLRAEDSSVASLSERELIGVGQVLNEATIPELSIS